MTLDPTYRTTDTAPAGGVVDGAQKWLTLIGNAQEAFSQFDEMAEDAEKAYADLEVLAASARGDDELKIFWANMEVLRPSIYARPPVPVVGPRFSDRNPLHRNASRLIERALVTFTAESDLHGVLKLVRDDLALISRGVAWARINEDGEVDVEHIDREDFIHDAARKWAEVRWVARRVWKGRDWIEDKFPGAEAEDLGLKDDDSEIKNERQVPIWEIWHKDEKRVVWVAEGYKDALKTEKAPLDLKGFFPCPKPAHGTLASRSLVPVPDYQQYRDQLSAINTATRRIGVLADLIKLRGFYDSSIGDTEDALRSAMARRSDDLLQGVPGLSQALAQAGGSLIEWFPIEQAAQAMQILIGNRAQLVQDVYEITGLSDIMRGTTVASETATAQNLKAQYGSVRVRERQEEMIRIARDLYAIVGEIMAEKVKPSKLWEMAQIEDVPAREDIAGQIKALDEQAQQQMAQAAQAAAQGQEPDPEAAQQAMEAYQTQRGELESTVTREDVEDLLRDQRIRPFALTIETDSTIQANEDAEKQRRMEFLSAIGNFIPQAIQLMQAAPGSAPLVSEMVQFAAGGFRAGRELEGPIEDFAQSLQGMAQQQGPSPEQEAQAAAAQAQSQKDQAEAALKQLEGQIKQAESQRDDALAQADIAVKQADAGLKQAQTKKITAESEIAGITAKRTGEEWADEKFAEAMTTQAQHEVDEVLRSVQPEVAV